MTQRRLNSMSLMAIEAELVRELDFGDFIKDFSSKKARKKPVVSCGSLLMFIHVTCITLFVLGGDLYSN